VSPTWANSAATFAISLTLPVTTWTGTAPYSLFLSSGASDERTIAFTPTGSAPGDQATIWIYSPVPGSAYTQTERVVVEVVGPCVAQAYQASAGAGLLDDLGLRGRWITLRAARPLGAGCSQLRET